MKNDDGGPVFPINTFTRKDIPASRGMSLRDWFAGQALAGLIAKGKSAEGAVAISYETADAMLAERDK